MNLVQLARGTAQTAFTRALASRPPMRIEGWVPGPPEYELFWRVLVNHIQPNEHGYYLCIFECAFGAVKRLYLYHRSDGEYNGYEG